MALNFDVSGIRNYQVVTTHPEDVGKENQRWHPVTEALIFASMEVDLCMIAEGNVEEWAWRLGLMQCIKGPWLLLNDKPLKLKLGDIQTHIGLRTNVSTISNRWTWARRKLGNVSIRDLNMEGLAQESASDLINKHYAALESKVAARN